MEGGDLPKNQVESSEQKMARLEEENIILKEANRLLLEQVGELTDRAFIDKLTGVKNRQALVEDFKLIFHPKKEGASERRAEGQENNVCVLMLDIDHFKGVNDTYGHQAGDQVLKAVAERLEGSIRDTDVIARYGGEEFIILLNEISEFETAKKAERLRKLIADVEFNVGTDDEPKMIPLTISIGLTFGSKNSDPDKLIQEADKALYQSKNSGRNQVTIHSEDLAKD
jgi:diguanylate cyclase (GGDEF)-like protein